MDQAQVSLFRDFKTLRNFYLTNKDNPEALMLHEKKLAEYTIPAPDHGRVLPQKYEWVVEYESGFIHVDTTSYIECEILYRGHYAVQLVNLIKSLLSPGDVVLDVGANIGCLTLPIAWSVGPTGRVIAFEPEPECFGRLQQNVLLNRLSQVSLYPLALSDNDNVHTLYLKSPESANRAGASLKQGTGFNREVQIRATQAQSVKELVQLTRCDLIKIDTEGHELVVLKQFKDMIARLQPHIIFEYEETTWRLHGNSYGEARTLLEDLGYKLYAIVEEMLMPVSPAFPFGRDLLCVPPRLRAK